jgi:hypothetical protein
MKGNIQMPRYEETTRTPAEVKPGAFVIGLTSIISAVLISTAVLGALIWVNVFIWSKVF